MKNTTLCYIEQDGRYLMMHRVKKIGDCNKDKWIGIGGHLEEYESPMDCILREAKEETGLTLTDCIYRGLVSFCSPNYETEQMHLFSAHTFEGTLREDCEEGDLQWISEDQLFGLPMWEGDRIFLRLLPQNVPFFLLKLVYDADGNLISHDLTFTADTRRPLLISACLLGTACRYDGKTKPLPVSVLKALSEQFLLIPVCGEVLGGLPTPRIPAEIQSDRTVLRRDGVDVTEEYRRGADEVLKYASLTDAKTALLKARSPSCGCGQIYDGTFSGALCTGNGITAQALLDRGIAVYTEEQLEKLGIYESNE
ncbi:MAG: DUF523 domain-containing protein [Clostridia bacterium]|nr:DUF523 domain-containing protein [Clostridia bacterium]